MLNQFWNHLHDYSMSCMTQIPDTVTHPSFEQPGSGVQCSILYLWISVCWNSIVTISAGISVACNIHVQPGSFCCGIPSNKFIKRSCHLFVPLGFWIGISLFTNLSKIHCFLTQLDLPVGGGTWWPVTLGKNYNIWWRWVCNASGTHQGGNREIDWWVEGQYCNTARVSERYS